MTFQFKNADGTLTRNSKIMIGGLAALIAIAALFLVLGLTIWKSGGTPAPAPRPLIVAGYAPMYANFRMGRAWFAPFKVNPNIYTHLILAFAAVDAQSNVVLTDMKSDNDGDYKSSVSALMRQYTSLRDGCSRDVLDPAPGGCRTTECEQIFQNFAGSLRPHNTNLKLILSVGGWNLSGPVDLDTSPYSVFHDILVLEPRRSAFINSCVTFIQNHKLDGIDIDIECPTMPQNLIFTPKNEDDTTGKDQLVQLQLEKKGFTALIQGLAAKLHPLNKLVSFAAGVGVAIDKAYEWKELGDAVDFINLMSYDYHGLFDSVTGPNAPLSDDYEESLNPKFNIRSCVEYIIAQGVDRAKLVVGLAAYGRTFPLKNATLPTDPDVSPFGVDFAKVDPTVCTQNTQLGAWPGAILQTKNWDLTKFSKFSQLKELTRMINKPAASSSAPTTQMIGNESIKCGAGFFTLTQGSLSFYEIMDLLKEQTPASKYFVDARTSTAYAYVTSGGPSGPQWPRTDSPTGGNETFTATTFLVSFDTLETYASKCQYVLDQKLGGVMIWSIADDDMSNEFPVSSFVYKYITNGGTLAGDDSPQLQQQEFMVTRVATPTGCDKCYISDNICVGDNWSTPGALTGYQQIGQQNCGCTYDWINVANPDVQGVILPELPPTCPYPPGVCTALGFNKNCYLSPDNKITLAGLGDPHFCKESYPQTYVPQFCGYSQTNNNSCKMCNSADDCGGGGLKCSADSDEACLTHGFCDDATTNDKACTPCQFSTKSDCPNGACTRSMSDPCTQTVKRGCCPRGVSFEGCTFSAPTGLPTDRAGMSCYDINGECGWCDSDHTKPLYCTRGTVPDGLSPAERAKCFLK
jgi:GH18 family chitinase